ncbi:MAG: citrate/2-methylcitrate synthase [Trebonia sp.]
MGEQVDARTAAERLGVDVRTLYAYVSRGALRRVPGPDGRSSRYDSDELELLARRSRPRTLPRPAASIDLVIATRVSTVTDGVIRYRGRDLLGLVAAGEQFEAVAELLWAGPSADEAAWRLPAGQASSLRLMLGPLGGDVPVAMRFAAAVAATAGDGSPGAEGPPDWPAWGRSLIATMVEASGHAQGDAGRVAGRLWRRWSPLSPTTARVRALNTALVLLAEHELAASTLAVLVAASARAAPPGCVLAGLGALSGTRHGAAPRIVRERLLSRPAAGSADGREAGDGARLPAGVGFGHPVHRHGDPRTAPLLRAVHDIATRADRELIERAGRGAPAPPNVDFALGALSHVARMPSEATTAIFAVARTAGWIAHAAEEYAEPYVRFRGRAVARPDSPRARDAAVSPERRPGRR